jgi:hypothetical protein
MSNLTQLGIDFNDGFNDKGDVEISWETKYNKIDKLKTYGINLETDNHINTVQVGMI